MPEGYGMVRKVNLRQIEAFKAVMETGTTTRAAGVLGVTQPAISKLINHLEQDTGLQLFDRIDGRLRVTRQGLKLFREIDRIFVGLGQLDNALDRIRRETLARLVVGVLPALSGQFFQRVACDFLRDHPEVNLAVTMRSSQFLAEWVANGQMDVALVSDERDSQGVTSQIFLEMPLVCVTPRGHELSRLQQVTADDLGDLPVVSYYANTVIRRQIDAALASTQRSSVIEVSASSMVCELVAGGLGVSLVHPVLAHAYRERIAIRPFIPEVRLGFVIARFPDTNNASPGDAFVRQVLKTASEISNEINTFLD